MSTSSANRNVVIITAITGFLCLCLCALFIAGVIAFRESVVRAVPALEPVLSAAQPGTATSVPTGRPGATLIPTWTPLTTEAGGPAQATVTPAPTREGAAPTLLSTSNLAPEIARSMDEIQQQVISIRGLQPSGTFTREVLTSDQLREKVINDFNSDTTPEDIRNEVLELSALGLLQPGFDLGPFYIDLLSEQIAGQYDNKTKEMYVVGDQFGGTERMSYSHEYTHALQDENFDIQNGLKYDTESCKQDSERCAGIQALIEGDAVQTETDWFTQYATAQDYADIMDFYNDYQSPVYDSAPEYMKEDLTFPYDAGQKFVEYLYKQGGWNAVNAAYANLPVSSEQIMHPERYPDDKPVIVPTVDLTATLGDGWQEVDHGVVGEWYTYLILAAGLDTTYRLDTSTAKTAAEGWGGDSYVAFYNEQSSETVMVLTYEWDTLKDADEFASALVRYGTKRFGQTVSSDAGQTSWGYSGGYAIFHQTGRATKWVLAPSQAIAQAVSAVVGP